MLPIQKFAAAFLLQGCVVGLTLLGSGAQNAVAAETAACQPGNNSSLDARLTKAADQSPQAFHVFVGRTRMIYEMNYPDAVARVDRFRQAQNACKAQIASAK